MPRKSKDTQFEEGQVVAIPVTGEGGKEELRPALITNIGGDGTTYDSTINYAFIEADGNLGRGGHAPPYRTQGWKHLDFCKVRTVVDLPPDWTKVATEFDRRAEEQAKKSPIDDWEPERHPSYGVVTLSRIQGSQSLFMSPFTHQHSMRLSIHRAVKHRGLSNDRTSTAGEVELIEIGMSEAQWARLLSAVGNGEGVPCTLMYVGAQQMPECPAQVEVEKFHADVEKDMEEAAEALEEAEKLAAALLEDKAPSKEKRKALLAALHKSRARLTDGVPFVAKQMRERMEHIVAEGKTEIEAFAQRTLQQTGLEKLLGEKVTSPVNLLPESKKGGES